MDSERFQRIMRLFQTAAELEPDRRGAYLDESCDDDELRREVDAMLAVDEGMPGRVAPISAGEGQRLLAAGIAQEPGDSPPATPPQSSQDPTRLGEYRIIRKIGEGGMGIVYLGIQERPQRIVALKVLKPDVATPELLRRFEHEAQVLGWLQHPGIARIYEANSYDPGDGPRPFISMEYIEGKTLTEYALDADNPLPVRGRLELFIRVCEAVAYAHQRGIIHRDLKPSNILVSDVTQRLGDETTKGSEPGRPRPRTDSDMGTRSAAAQPKILDFGVARLIDADLQAVTLHTSAGEVVGTLAYMSPEQAAGENRDVDTRSDVYSLGVILYELLTERLPHALSGRSLLEAVRIIRDEAPTPPREVVPALGGELETIVCKALSKEKDRRYQSAAEFADDVERYLTNRPIAAKRDSGWYVLRKSVERHKVAVSLAAAFILLIAGSAVSLGVMHRRQNLAHRQAEAARDAERAARGQAEAVSTFLQRMLYATHPGEGRGRDVRMRDVLDQAAATIDTELAGQPQVEAAVRMTMGHTYLGLGVADAAEHNFEAALAIRRRELPTEHVDVADALHGLSLALKDQGRYARAEELCREALTMRRGLLDESHAGVLESLGQLASLHNAQGKYEAAEALFRDVVDRERRLYGTGDTALAQSINDLAVHLHATGKLDEAERLHREALTMRRELLGPRHINVAQSLKNLGALLHTTGDLEEAERVYRDALAIYRAQLDENHPSVAGALGNLATVLQDRGNLDEAEPLLREALAIYRRTLGDRHPEVATCVNNLAQFLVDKRDYRAAEPLAREALEIAQATLGPQHDAVGKAMLNLGSLMDHLGRSDEADRLMKDAQAILQGSLGRDHPTVATNLHNLAMRSLSRRRFDEAEAYMIEARDIFRRQLGDKHPNVVHCTNSLGVICHHKGDYDRAETLFREALAIQRERFGPDSPTVANTLVNLGGVLLARDEFDPAEALLQKALAIQRKVLSPSHLDMTLSMTLVAKLLLERRAPGDVEKADVVLRECLDIRGKTLPADHWQVIETEGLLGESLTLLRRFEQAESVLLESHRKLEAAGGPRGEQGRELLARLVRLYRAWDRSDDADKWASRREKLSAEAVATP